MTKPAPKPAEPAPEAVKTTTELDPPPVQAEASGGGEPASDPTPDAAARDEPTPGDPAGASGHIGGDVAKSADPVTEGMQVAMDAKRDQLAEGVRILLQSIRQPMSVDAIAAQLRERRDDVKAAAEASEFLRVEDDSVILKP